MAKVVFALTAAQAKALVNVAKSGDNGWADYGTSTGLVSKGWLRRVPSKDGSYYREKMALTKRGRIVLALVRELKLDRDPPATAAGAP